ALAEIERKDVVASLVGTPHAILESDKQNPICGVDRIGVDPDKLDSRFIFDDRISDLRLDACDHRHIHHVEDEVIDAASKIGPHYPLASRRVEDDADRFVDIVLIGVEPDAPGIGVYHDGIGPAAAQPLLLQRALLRFRDHPISTVVAPSAMELGPPGSMMMSP